MAEIKYTEHLKLRLESRKIPEEFPEMIYEDADQNFFDNLEGTFIAVKELYYNDKLRNMMIAYEIEDNEIKIITIHPITNEQIINRTIKGRWTKQ